MRSDGGGQIRRSVRALRFGLGAYSTFETPSSQPRRQLRRRRSRKSSRSFPLPSSQRAPHLPVTLIAIGERQLVPREREAPAPRWLGTARARAHLARQPDAGDPPLAVETSGRRRVAQGRRKSGRRGYGRLVPAAAPAGRYDPPGADTPKGPADRPGRPPASAPLLPGAAPTLNASGPGPDPPRWAGAGQLGGDRRSAGVAAVGQALAGEQQVRMGAGRLWLLEPVGARLGAAAKSPRPGGRRIALSPRGLRAAPAPERRPPSRPTAPPASPPPAPNPAAHRASGAGFLPAPPPALARSPMRNSPKRPRLRAKPNSENRPVVRC